jgi:hypothetical protein
MSFIKKDDVNHAVSGTLQPTSKGRRYAGRDILVDGKRHRSPTGLTRHRCYKQGYRHNQVPPFGACGTPKRETWSLFMPGDTPTQRL